MYLAKLILLSLVVSCLGSDVSTEVCFGECQEDVTSRMFRETEEAFQDFYEANQYMFNAQNIARSMDELDRSMDELGRANDRMHAEWVALFCEERYKELKNVANHSTYATLTESNCTDIVGMSEEDWDEFLTKHTMQRSWIYSNRVGIVWCCMMLFLMKVGYDAENAEKKRTSELKDELNALPLDERVSRMMEIIFSNKK